jgi:hypothetical protein
MGMSENEVKSYSEGIWVRVVSNGFIVEDKDGIAVYTDLAVLLVDLADWLDPGHSLQFVWDTERGGRAYPKREQIDAGQIRGGLECLLAIINAFNKAKVRYPDSETLQAAPVIVDRVNTVLELCGLDYQYTSGLHGWFLGRKGDSRC